MKRSTRNFLRKYYLSEKTPWLFMALFGTVSITSFICIYLPLKNLTFNYFKEAVLPGILIIFYMALKFLYQKCSTEVIISKIESPFSNIYTKDKDIDRKEQYNEIEKYFICNINNNNLSFVIGASGSGKTNLIERFKQERTNDFNLIKITNYNYSEVKENLNKFLSFKGTTLKKIIIMDQFEKILLQNIPDLDENICTIDFIKDIINIHKDRVNFIFVLRDDSLGKILDEFNFIDINYYYLKNTNDDLKYIKYELKKYIRGGNTGAKPSKQYEFLENKILYDFEKNKMTLIEYRIIMNYLRTKKWVTISEQLNEKSSAQADTDRIIDMYFSEVISNLPDSLTGMCILYYLCRENRRKDLFSKEEDFKNITFADDKIIEETLKYLEDQGIIQNPSNYMITHDYLSLKLEEYCNRHLDSSIMNSINFHTTHKNETIDIDNKTSPYIRQFIKGKKFIKYSMILLSIAIISYSGYILWNASEEFDYIEFGCVSLLCGMSIYYIYMHAFHFMALCGSFKISWSIAIMYYLSIFGGGAAILLAYIKPHQWAFWFGTEIIILAFSYLVISKKYDLPYFSKASFEKHFIVFIVIGIAITSLYFYVTYLNQDMTPYYILYSVYIMMSIITHINRPYMLAKIGYTICEFTEINVNVKKAHSNIS